jgi:hypothetical protein
VRPTRCHTIARPVEAQAVALINARSFLFST